MKQNILEAFFLFIYLFIYCQLLTFMLQIGKTLIVRSWEHKKMLDASNTYGPDYKCMVQDEHRNKSYKIIMMNSHDTVISEPNYIYSKVPFIGTSYYHSSTPVTFTYMYPTSNISSDPVM
jgi:hypothetical protein